ncbi:MAG TPA: MFS transporter, partial [Microthrixaceae bacterium]|nr:MFS transporter [Microthrixaceae bacterium]
AKEQLLTLRFITVVTCGLFYFMSLGMQLPTVPKFIEGPLGGSDLMVGVLVGSFSIGAVLVRPLAGRIGDNKGRRLLIIGGALLVAASVMLYNLTTTAPMLFGARLVGGVGEAAFFVGAGTMATDLAPVSRRGEAISYWSVAVYGGLAFGPSLGEWVLNGDHYGRVWVVAASLALVSAIIGAMTRETAVLGGEGGPSPLINRTAVGPGLVLFLGMMGLAGFGAFVPLYVAGIGLDDSSTVFLLYGCTILGVRLVGARIPDKIGTLRAGSLATIASAVGLVVIGVTPTPTGLYLGTFIFSLGMSLLYPSMLTMALIDVPDSQRGSAVGTISSFFDLSQGFGAAILGVAVSLGGYRAAFLAAAAMALAALTLLRGRVDLRFRTDIADGPVAALEGPEVV